MTSSQPLPLPLGTIKSSQSFIFFWYLNFQINYFHLILEHSLRTNIGSLFNGRKICKIEPSIFGNSIIEIGSLMHFELN